MIETYCNFNAHYIFWIFFSLSFLIGLLINTFYYKKRSFVILLKHTKDAIHKEGARVYFLCCIAFAALAAFPTHHGEHYFHVFLEFTGAIILFLIVEHVLKNLKSGIKDPDKLPLDEFIDDIVYGTKELILYDTVFEKLAAENSDYFDKMKKAIKNAFSTNEKFSVRILIMKQNHDGLKLAAGESIEKLEYFNKKVAMAKMKFMNMVAEVNLSRHHDIKILEYSARPTFCMYSIDGKAYISFDPINSKFLPHNMKPTESSLLYIPNNTDLGKEIYTYFKDEFSVFWKIAEEDPQNDIY